MNLTLLSVALDSMTGDHTSITNIIPDVLVAMTLFGAMAMSKKQHRKMKWLMRLARIQSFFSRLRGKRRGSSKNTRSALIVLLVIAITLALGIFVSWLAALIALVIMLCLIALNIGPTSRK